MSEHHHIQCHYDVLRVARDADAATVKKAHRKLALQFHPDKNSSDEAHAQFQLIQQAYECLSDPAERKWYDQHRDAILKGWSANNNDGTTVDILFDIVPYQHPSCYEGYGNDEHEFFGVYRRIFQQVYQGEEEGWVSEGHSIEDMPLAGMPVDFGTDDKEWSEVAAFYQSWESFASCLSYAWADVYDTTQDDASRRVRRAMEEENEKKRRSARKERNDDVLALVHFCKRRDPRVKAHYERTRQEKERRQAEQLEEARRRKVQTKEAREAWRAEAGKTMAELEEEDRLAGRVRLADLEDDYDYGGSKRGKKGKKKNKNDKHAASDTETKEQEANNGNRVDGGIAEQDQPLENGDGEEWTDMEGGDISNDFESKIKSDDVEETAVDNTEYVSQESESEESESEGSEPDVWRCECCRKDFKSEGQMQNHLKSKKHKEAWKKYEKKLQNVEHSEMEELLDELALDP